MILIATMGYNFPPSGSDRACLCKLSSLHFGLFLPPVRGRSWAQRHLHFYNTFNWLISNRYATQLLSQFFFLFNFFFPLTLLRFIPSKLIVLSAALASIFQTDPGPSLVSLSASSSTFVSSCNKSPNCKCYTFRITCIAHTGCHIITVNGLNHPAKWHSLWKTAKALHRDIVFIRETHLLQSDSHLCKPWRTQTPPHHIFMESKQLHTTTWELCARNCWSYQSIFRN